MAESSLFKGLGDYFTPGGGSGGTNQPIKPSRLSVGQVIEICLGQDSPLYKSPKDIGAIRFRNLDTDYNKSEKDIANFAYPLDRSVAKYPMPGEEIFLFRGVGAVVDSLGNRTLSDTYFYSLVVSSMFSTTYNVDPFLNTDARHVDGNNPLVSPKFAESRFDRKLKDLGLVKELAGKLKLYKQLQPFEGDFILQGRFGNTIRFGSTATNQKTQWSGTPNAPGQSGDGIMVLRVDRDYTTKSTDMFTTEDINTDDSSIHLCSSQMVPLKLSCSKNLKSWKARFNLKDA